MGRGCPVDLGEALYREIAKRSPHTEVQTFADALRYYVGGAESVSAAARELGVPRRTLRGWLEGRQPRGGGGWLVDEARREQRRERLSPARERKLRAPGALDDVKIVGGLTYGSTPDPDRDYDVGSWLDEVQNDIIDAYLDGASTDELAEIFHEGINDGGFYADVLDPGDYGTSQLHVDITDIEGWG